MIDPQRFTSPVQEGGPSGPNLEYDPEFLALERAQQGRPEQVIGSVVKPGEDPDWPDVRTRAEALLARTRDLRVGVALTMSLLHTEGFTGLAAGLAILRGLLETQWHTVHPQLDAEDDNDATSRINSLAMLGAVDGLPKALREIPLLQSRALGRYSLRDLRIASGKQPVPAGLADPPQQARIDAAFLEADLKGLQAVAAAVGAALDHLGAMDRIWSDKAAGAGPELQPLVADLSELKFLLAGKLAARGDAAAAGVLKTASGSSQRPAENSNGSAERGTLASSETVASREDVVRVLERLCEYYRRHEPSSPVPLLLQRAKRLVAKDFLEIIRDLTPSGLAEAELFGGVEKQDE